MSEEIGDIGERRDRSDRLLDEFSARLVLANHTHPRNFQNIYSHLQARLFPEGFDWVKLIRPGHVSFRKTSLRFWYNSWLRTTSAAYQIADLKYLRNLWKRWRMRGDFPSALSFPTLFAWLLNCLYLWAREVEGNINGGIYWLKEEHLFPFSHQSFTGAQGLLRNLLMGGPLMRWIGPFKNFACLFVLRLWDQQMLTASRVSCSNRKLWAYFFACCSVNLQFSLFFN